MCVCVCVGVGVWVWCGCVYLMRFQFVWDLAREGVCFVLFGLLAATCAHVGEGRGGLPQPVDSERGRGRLHVGQGQQPPVAPHL